MDLKEEFITLALQPDANRRELCRRFNISPQTGYKWLRRFQENGQDGLKERSRRPLGSPHQASPELEAQIVALRQQHPAWGGRKLSRRLRDRVLRRRPGGDPSGGGPLIREAVAKKSY